MNIREISGEEFNNFAKKHMLKNFYQTKEYGDLMSHSDFSVMYIGGFQNNIILCASLIMYKNIGPNMKYGYAPRGFLIDYYNIELLEKFTRKIKEYFFKKGFAFIKINPEITYSKIDFENKSKSINPKSKELINKLKELGYDKLKDNLYFESLLPKYTPVIYLQEYNFDNLNEVLKENIKNYEISGLKLINGNENDIKTFYKFIDDKDSKTLTYYNFLYKTFKKSDMIDLILCELDYNIYVKYLQKEFVNEQEKNDKINFEFNNNPNNNDIYMQKTKSDQALAKIQSEITSSNNRKKDHETKAIIGGAIIIKHQGRVTILSTGESKKIKNIDIKSYIYYKIIESYKKAGYNYIDLNGITADFSDTNPYKELNNFKLKFNPDVFEYIGEFDLIINKTFHQFLWSTNQIQKEFYRPAIKNK